ncbi:MAG: GxxExxY protein [Chitinophagaceae bacterium]
MIKPEYKHSEITEIIIGCAMHVHSKLGKGFPEVIYQRAFQIELAKARLQVEREMLQDVYYDDQLVGKRKVDFLINKTILIEIKAASDFDASHFNQNH